MIKSTMAMFPRTLLLLICFALFCFMPGCGGSGGGGGEDGEAVTYSLAITTTPDLTTFQAGEIVTITATVTGSDGLAASGQAVTFTIFRNNSGGTLTIAGTGTTDSDGRAQATYTLGPNDSSEAVTDTIEVSIPGSSETITVNRSAGTVVQDNIASLDLAATPTSIKTDNSNTSTITINALTEGNAILSGVTVNVSTDTGVLSAPSVTTPGNVTLSCGGTNKANRTATITATTGTLPPQQIPIQIIGSTVTLASGSSSISTSGSTTLTVTAKDAGSNVVSGTAVTLTQSGTGSVAFGAIEGTTNASGQFTTTVSGNTNGTVTITATALGATATANLTITDTASVFSIDQQRLCPGAYPGSCNVIANNPSSAMQLGQILEIRVNAPASANVVFATTQGILIDPADAETGNVIKAVVDGSNKATAYLTTSQAGSANINVYSETAGSSTNDSLTVYMTSPNAYSVTLQASPTVVPKSVGTTTGSSTLIAMVRDSYGFPVGNALVAFSIVNPTGGGESVSPVVAITASTAAGGLNLGEARASFASGTLPSGQTQKSVSIRASVIGTSVATGTSPSGNDASIVIGGVAGSVAIGQATVLGVDDTAANYTLQMSVLVADSNGNPAPEGTVVNLSLWPIAWSTGGGCMYDMNGWTYNPTTLAYDIACAECGTFWNEDVNENLILDNVEDGARNYYLSESQPSPVFRWGTPDGYITAVNSAAGTVPATVTTDANGVAGFTLIYPKTSSIWTVVRIRASTIVQGTETVGEVSFRLDALQSDVTPTCKITGSPYHW